MSDINSEKQSKKYTSIGQEISVRAKQLEERRKTHADTPKSIEERLSDVESLLESVAYTQDRMLESYNRTVSVVDKLTLCHNTVKDGLCDEIQEIRELLELIMQKVAPELLALQSRMVLSFENNPKDKS